MANGINVMVALVLLYFVITCGILLKKLRALNSLPYDRYQGAIVFYRLQVKDNAADSTACCSCCHVVCAFSVSKNSGSDIGSHVCIFLTEMHHTAV